MTARRTVSSPIGDLVLESDGTALTAIRFGDASPGDETAGTAPDSVVDTVLDAAARQLEEYFAGTRTTFDLPLRPDGTSFQHEVWSGLTEIPYGETRSYGQLATRIGRPGAARAIGAGCGRNPIPVVVPCHRVVGADGALTGYAGGTAVKSALLRLEARTLASESHLAAAGPVSATHR